MELKEAHVILNSAMEQALANGLFKDFKSANLVQAALIVVEKVASEVNKPMQMASTNGGSATPTN